MRKDALFKRYEIFVAAAVIGAHANAPEEGFRQREVRFVIELFSNWGGIGLETEMLELSNTQVQRYLDSLVAEGYARKISRKKWPYYRLSRTGLIELVGRMVNIPFVAVPAQFFFVFYFISNYRDRIIELVRIEGKQFPFALRLELEGLLDVQALLKRQIGYAEKEIRKCDERSADSVKGSKLAARLYAQGIKHLEVAQEVEKMYPYQLNSQRPLSELLQDIPVDIGRWEIEVGGTKRAEQIFAPTRQGLSSYVQQLKRLVDGLPK